MSANTALLVIDVQKSFLARPFWKEEETAIFRRSLLELIAGTSAKGVPAIAVYHHNMREEGSPFHPDSGLVEPMDWLDYKPVATFCKTAHNAFTDTGLDRWLRMRGVTRLIISGIRTEQCCETTARVASDLGYAVDFVSEATQTFAMKAENGRLFSASEIRERTELVLAGRFARIATVEMALASLE